ncbi:MAG: UDP-N-acetylglucosamine--N-acetylmuramyl-(pentapeptide) pyrophosphoryl-undecaprenol N-acetylglucosamine transferase [Alteromonas naphthalenivorans]|jgi:UDP-N-acetylglucosamine--N-acetylmuramyl-(pentapeptide) pyrophosphoryl-undecaprenol N-acetylglucosamine transferase
MKKTIICGVAARSGGHIIPCLTRIEQERSKDTDVFFFTTHTELDATISKQFPWIAKHITLNFDNVPYKKPWLLPLFMWQFTRSFFKSLVVFIQNRPQKIVSTGGYISIPVCLAARCLLIPVELLELNVKPGKASRFIAPCAKNLFITFKDTQKYFRRSCSLLPYPVRFAIKDKQTHHKTKALASLDYDPEKITLFILGGSQGSTFLNNLICRTIQFLDRSKLQIIHQSGTNETEHLTTFYEQMHIPAHVFSYEQQITKYYQAADIVICRSGAGTLFETAFFEKQCITIPLEIAGNTHQVDNAYAMHTMHPQLFTVLEQKTIAQDPMLLATQLLYLLNLPMSQEQ